VRYWRLSVQPAAASAYQGMARLDEFLTATEFDALEQIGEGENWPVSQSLTDRLIELDYIRKTSQGFEITSAGRMRLAFGR
jgi:hypothetical protein